MEAVAGTVEHGIGCTRIALKGLPSVAIPAGVVLPAEKEESGLAEGLREYCDVE